MNRLWVLLFCLPALASDLVPNRYIVELSTESVGAHLIRATSRVAARTRLHNADAEAHRTAVRAQQATVRTAVQSARGRVLGSAETVRNALVVEIPDAEASRLASIPGVVKVEQARYLTLHLDHALPLHNVPQAWSQVGIANAGAGIKIGLIDTGIDVGHPGFADAGFTAPSGFPLADSKSDLAYTNNKVIVARSYAALFPTPDPDLSAADHIGHGTATAMVAGGVSNAGPLATISGVAPQAWLAAYKVFGTPGYNDNASSDVVMLAVEDAVNDGMDVISMSLGGVAYNLNVDSEVQLLDTVESLGVIVVVSAGNAGSGPSTIGSPASAPLVIAAGANNNDRLFAAKLLLPDSTSVFALPGSGAYAPAPITGPAVDVATLDGNGQACASLPAASLTAAVALIFRGTCPFEAKIDNAQAAGASAVVVYDNNPDESPITMGVGAASLPAVFISNADGLALKGQLTAALQVTLQVAAPYYSNPASIAPFSSRGPDVDYSIKPDVLATGENIYTAAQKLDSNGELYNATGYTLQNGTSFSAPLVAGAAAIVKQARPGLTTDQYRSLLINSAAPASLLPGTPASVQQGGAGVLDVLAALNATVAASPVSLGLGTGTGSVNASKNLTLTNIGTVSDTFQIAIIPAASSSPAPSVTTSSVALDPGASYTLPVTFQADTLSPGAYEGFLTVQGIKSGTTARIPYWFGVPSTTPAHITILDSAASGTAGGRVGNAITFRVTDPIGLPITNLQPSVSAVTDGAQVGSLTPLTSIPNAWSSTVRLAPQAGNNVYQIQAGDLTATVTIVGR